VAELFPTNPIIIYCDSFITRQSERKTQIRHLMKIILHLQ
jgi:hypothetical protein